MATSYKEIGLVNTKQMFKKAIEGQFAVPAYNFKAFCIHAPQEPVVDAKPSR